MIERNHHLMTAIAKPVHIAASLRAIRESPLPGIGSPLPTSRWTASD
jgi:hypothetical protein